MALKKPSDFFDESKKESIIENLVKKPELKSFSDAFNLYKENISKFEDLSETLKSIESIQSDIKDFIKKEDLDNAVVSYAFLLEETISKLKNDVTGINEKNLISMRSNISNLTEKVNNFFKIDVPKYKKNIVEIEIKSSDKFEKYKNDTDIILEDISKYVSDKYESIDGINKDTILEIEKSISKHQIDIEQRTEKNISSINETVDRVVEDLEEKINLISDNKDAIFQDLSKKITEVKNLKKSVNKDLKVYEDHKNNVENKISDLEIEVIRSKSNLKNQNEEFIKVKKDIGNDFNTIHEEFKTVVNRLNLDELEEKNIQLSKKVKYLEEIFDKFNEKEFLNEGLVNITPETDNSDPLTPLDKNYVTLNQLQDHYRLFLNRIQQQLSTLGGGGETRLQYLDDIVGVATNLSAYNGKFLKIDTSQPAGKNFVFETVSGGGGGSTGVGGTWAVDNIGIHTTKKVGIGTTAKSGYSLFVEGDTRITGILTIGTASVTIDGSDNKINVGSATTIETTGFRIGDSNIHSTGMNLGTGVTCNNTGDSFWAGTVTAIKSHVGLDTGFFNEDLVVTGDARVTGILTIGTGSITLDPNAKKITGVDEIEIGNGSGIIKIKKSSRGTIDFVDKDNISIGGIGSEAKINTTGVITATTFVGDLTGTATTATNLENQAASYYLNYDNFSNTPTIPTNNNELTNGAGFITTSFTNTNQLTNGAGFITAAGTLTNGTQTNITSIGTLTSLEVNGDVSIGGTLTYEDVNNIDSVGLVTARRGIVVGSGYGIHVASGVITATTFDGNLATSNLTGTITNAQLAGSIADGKLASTFLKNVVEDTTPQLGGNLDGNSKNIYGLGIATVTQHFSGDITGVGATFTNITGTLVTAAQTNVTSLGNLTGLAVNGDLDLYGSAGVSSVTWDKSDNALKFKDHAKAKFGTSGDLQIYHNANNSWIQDIGTGSLILASNGAGVKISKNLGGENIAEFLTDGACNLYFDNAKKIETSYTGAIVSGIATATGGFSGDITGVGATFTNITGTLVTGAQTNITSVGTIGAGTWQGTAVADFYVASATTWNAKIANVLDDTTPQLGGNLDGTSKSIFGVGVITATTLDISGNVDIDGQTDLDVLNVAELATFSNDVTISRADHATLTVQTSTNSSHDALIKIRGARTALTNDTSMLQFDNKTGSPYTLAQISAQDPDADHTSKKGQLVFRTNSGNNLTEKLRITSAGDVGIGTDNPDGQLNVYRDDAQIGHQIQISQDGTGDATLGFELVGTRAWSMGIDNSDSDKFKISNSAGLGSNIRMTVTNDGDVGIGTDNPTGAAALTNNEAVLAVGVVTATTLYGNVTGTATTATNLASGANITTGTINVARLGTGASATKFLRGDNTWQTVSAGGGIALTDLSVTTNSVGTAALTYNNSNGVFTYTPPDLSGKQDSLTFGIADTNALKVNDSDAADDDYAKFTASGIEGRSYAEVKTDLSLNNVENTALSTWVGTSNITTLGTIATGTWQGTAVADFYVASATTWNAKIANVLDDTTPQLGGNLDANSKSIYGVGILTATQIADGNSQVGAAGSVLSSTGSGLSWVAQSGGGGGTTNLSNIANGTSLTIESSSGNNTSLPAATTSAWGVMSDDDKTNLDANTAKVTNATHTGDVTGATVLTIADDKIEEKHINAGGTPGADKVLVYDSSESTNWKWATQSGGGGGGSQNLFQTIAVSGQSNVVADSTTDTLTLVAGTNVTITTDDSADSVTINASGGGGGGGGVSEALAIAYAIAL